MTTTSDTTQPDSVAGPGVKPIISGVLRMVMFPVVILVPAGTWRWPEAWAIVGLYVAFSLSVALWLRKHDPELLAERMKASPVQAGQKTWDKVIQAAFFPLGVAMMLIPGFDHRWGWTSVPVAVEAVAMASQIPAFVWIGWVMKENTYLSRVVKIDEARGHHVITTGPYAFVRHPMYTAVTAMLLAFPIALGSWVAVAPAAAMVILLIVRTSLEDRTLHQELPGYPEYAQKTRYRLIPGIW